MANLHPRIHLATSHLINLFKYTVEHLSAWSCKTRSPCMTMTPAMIALVVAMAGMMLPAIDLIWSGQDKTVSRVGINCELWQTRGEMKHEPGIGSWWRWRIYEFWCLRPRKQNPWRGHHLCPTPTFHRRLESGWRKYHYYTYWQSFLSAIAQFDLSLTRNNTRVAEFQNPFSPRLLRSALSASTLSAKTLMHWSRVHVIWSRPIPEAIDNIFIPDEIVWKRNFTEVNWMTMVSCAGDFRWLPMTIIL